MSETIPDDRIGIRGRSIEPWHRQVAEERGLVLAECGTTYEPEQVERRQIIPREPTCPVCWGQAGIPGASSSLGAGRGGA